MKLARVLCSVGAVLLASEVAADLKVKSPAEVCNAVSTMGLATSGWKQQYGMFSCVSPYKDLGGGPASNNLAFYADGEASQVTQVKLVLNVNDRATGRGAHTELAKAAKALCLKVTGSPLPEPLAGAIGSGTKASGKAGPSTIEVIREDWPTGKGYEVRVLIR